MNWYKNYKINKRIKYIEKRLLNLDNLKFDNGEKRMLIDRYICAIEDIEFPRVTAHTEGDCTEC